jgi:hypothetical protein
MDAMEVPDEARNEQKTTPREYTIFSSVSCDGALHENAVVGTGVSLICIICIIYIIYIIYIDDSCRLTIPTHTLCVIASLYHHGRKQFSSVQYSTDCTQPASSKERRRTNPKFEDTKRV